MSESTPAGDWQGVLGQIQQSLEQSLEQSGALEPPPESPGDPHALAVILQRLEQRLNRLEAFLQGAENEAARADSLLGAEVQALEQWLAAWSGARQALARLAGNEPG
jgi:hypothetical protein